MIKKVNRVVGSLSTAIVLVASIFCIIIGVIGSVIQSDPAIVLVQANNTDSNMNPIIMHIHPLLSVLVNNSAISVPEQIGIDPSLWKDHSLDGYGMQSMPEMNMSAMAPLHTHDNSGIVHVESTINRNYTLGEFLDIWGLNLNDKTVKVTTNGKPLANFREHILRDGEQIKLEIQ
jgi:sulfur carrier protein ThiS